MKTSRISPADLADLRERFRATLLKLELREQDVQRLEARNTYLESELKRAEQHLTNAPKDNIVLKQAAVAERPKRRAHYADATRGSSHAGLINLIPVMLMSDNGSFRTLTESLWRRSVLNSRYSCEPPRQDLTDL
jgi:hypothetical protein